MTISPIETFRVKDTTIHQSIGLENDIVTFVNCETNKIIFSMEPDCRTFYHGKDHKRIYIGKFGYTDSYAIKFVYDEAFALNNNVGAADNRTIFFFDSRLTAIKDFIKAEKVFVDTVLTNYPEIFKIC